MNYTLPFVLAAALLLLAGTGAHAGAKHRAPSLSKISVGADGLYKDDAGRTRIFHGFNEVLKEWPWYPPALYPSAARYPSWKEWGFNAVRLGMMWQGVEPAMGQYNETYLAVMKTIVQRFGEQGIYVILDMHQDVLSSLFDAYDGIPKWLVSSFPASRLPYPWPLDSPPDPAAWAAGYFTDAVGNAFQQFYDNTNGAVDHFGKFWAKVADTFGEMPNVLGYELINEPWCGDIFRNPLLLLPGNAGRLNLGPLYDKAAQAIRQVDNKTIIFFEPVTWGYVFNGNVLGIGLDHVPGGDEYRNRSAISFHYYCWVLQGSNTSIPYPEADRIMCDELLGPKVFEAVSNDAKALGGGVFLTEFGECDPDGNANSTNTIECNSVLAKIDEYMYSWTFEDTDFFYGNNTVMQNELYPFTRPYPMATAGTPKKIVFDIETGVFNFFFAPDPKAKKPTEIFVPPEHYANGSNVWVSPGFKWSRDSKDPSIVYIEPSKYNINHIAGDVHVVIVPL